MKKTILALLLAMLLCVSCFAETVETVEPETPAVETEQTETEGLNYDKLIVGTTTAFGGDFFTDMWGNHTSDQDVRVLLNGYTLVDWDVDQAAFSQDDSVVSGLAVTGNKEGDHICVVSLYDDLYYSDGTQITAADYAFSVLLQASPEIRDIGAARAEGDYILGMEDYRSGESYVLPGIRINSDTQFTVTISHEYLPFFYELGLLNITPYPISVLAPGCEVIDDGYGVYIHDIDGEPGEKSTLFTAELLNETILNPETGYLYHPSVVSGPYVMTGYDGEVCTFVRNTYYKGNEQGIIPQIDELEYRYVPAERIMEALATGEIQLANKVVSAENIAAGMDLVGGEGFSFDTYARTGYAFFNCNTERVLMSDVEVRRAIAECFDKDAFVAEYLGNYGLRVDSYYGIGQWMYQAAMGTLTITPEVPESEGEETNAETPIEEPAEEGEAVAEPVPTLDEMIIYAFDTEAATQRLIEDGWTLNLEGEEFNPEKDTVRCKKQEDETILALSLKMIYPAGNKAAEFFEASFIPALAEAGIELTMEPVELPQLLQIYYRREERDCDLIYLATNFNLLFDPVGEFVSGSEEMGSSSFNALYDEELKEYAIAMRSTEPGQALEYLGHWVDFIERWAEILPTIPVYGNVYIDFYIPELHDYTVVENYSWAKAIVNAYLSDADDNIIGAAEEMEEDDGNTVIIE